jgi:anti-sigma factor RsiW
VTCRELATFLADYLDGQLPAETRHAFAHHLSLCPNCVRYLEQYKASIAVGRAAITQIEQAVTDDFPDDLRQAILGSRPRT